MINGFNPERRMMFHNKPAWHGLGTVKDLSGLTVTQAWEETDNMYEVYAVNPQGKVPSVFGDITITLPDKQLILREPTQDDPEWRCFGIVGNRYQIIQNRDIARILDPVTDVWHIETTGSLGLGQTLFITFDMGDRTIAGEQHKCYLLVNENKDGISAMHMALVIVRVVCQNTLNAALKSAIIKADIAHLGSVENELTFRTNLLLQAEAARQTYMDTFEALAKVALSNDEARKIIADAYPMPPKSQRALFREEIKDLEDASLTAMVDLVAERDVQYRSDLKKMESLRADAFELFQNINDTAPTIAQSPLAVFNAVAELEDWRTGTDTVPASILWGTRAKVKQRAFNSALTFLR